MPSSGRGGTENKVSRKLDVFGRHLTKVDLYLLSLNKVTIIWRNRRVHILSENQVSHEDRHRLKEQKVTIATEFNGLDPLLLLEHVDSATAPTFKEAAGLISAAHTLVQQFDRELLG
jgi:hypothetical protein